MRTGTKTVKLTEETHRQLSIIKAKNGKKSIDEAIQLLLEKYIDK